MGRPSRERKTTDSESYISTTVKNKVEKAKNRTKNNKVDAKKIKVNKGKLETKSAPKIGLTPSNDNPLVNDNKEKHRGISEGTKETAMFVGAHCSIAGGVANAVNEAYSLGAKAFALFVRNGRTWKQTPLKETDVVEFKKACKEHNYPPHLILPHGSYLLNCGSTNPETLKKSQDTLIYELQICERLGLSLYNFHPGSACNGGTVDQCIDTISASINFAHSKTASIKTVIENMSCQGQTIGGKFEELAAIIAKVKDKARIGVCLDTCHAFAAGFDLSREDGYTRMMTEFNEKIGFKYLSGIHLNDSKGELGCHLDRHENIGKGHIGLEGFRRFMNEPRFENIPMILETPVGDYSQEIKTLYKLREL